ncbi:endonuclease domain-containing 1 protein [Ictalurus punctatus]|uniref:Endonuclease domain-containing 1 protein n=1 Tax=Ictalurus punctatus TaxID=7998 RepID=A0A2D0S4L4_ICTPU|nr:endonuclease domain-containing 1 protein [Ictalurus punctatus]XP_053540153.1 endonuclease domain-containing 1 protein [Ictalurus punctatus]XP_053540154.1 endonuclease domain-containing 1 protein [Ictalurus punctatus]XP_053540155.1 endonuclease domain-containing 1 protein [Ictalurus punctatus]
MRMKLLALVLLLSTFSSLTLTMVVNSFKQSCPSFFIRNPEVKNEIIIPTIFHGDQYKKICQLWKKATRFATVYDTVRRIPVYSAYTLLKVEKTKRSDVWKIEPQLEDINEYKNKKEMMDSPRDLKTLGNIINQAVDLDYGKSVYTRGHVFPRSYAANQDQANSTFTLTNIAPQTQNSNGAWAKQVEEPMRTEIKNICRLDQKHLAYIVTGVVPGNNWITITRGENNYEKGINIPSHFWSAFCCTGKNDHKELISKAYIAELVNFNVLKLSISRLNKRLTELYGQNFSVFPGLSVEKIQPPF